MSVNRAVRLHGKQDLRIENLPIPEPEENHVQVKMSTVGLCRTDVHLFEEGRVDYLVIDKPITIGHEISGTVSKLGPGVTSLAVGDRVAIDPCRPCGYCVQCKKPRTNMCLNMILSGVIKIDGGFATYMTTPAYTCHKLPDNVSLEEGAMIEPLSVGVNAVRRARMSPGESVIVTGAGPVGLYAMQVAKALGASKVMMVDINADRLRLASNMGADIVFKPTLPTSDPKAASEELKAAFGGEADLFIECSGATGILDVAIHSCARGGKVMMIGFGEMAMHAHVGMAAVREIDILGAFANDHNYPEAVELVASGKVDVKSAITHRLPLDKVLEGMELIKSGKSVKVVIDCAS
ncbi:hypothetical protein BsWGS_00461 [Bradybaena similaris]